MWHYLFYTSKKFIIFFSIVWAMWNSFSFSEDSPIEIDECEICLEKVSIIYSKCCLSTICSNYFYLHLSTNINEGQIRISCPLCSYLFTLEEILSLLTKSDYQGSLIERYKCFYVNTNDESHMKVCPKCCSIEEIDKDLVEGVRWEKRIPRKVLCNEWQFE